MKTKLNLKIALISILILGTLLSGQAFAANIPNDSNITPTRPAIPYEDGQTGLLYPSFNNYKGDNTVIGDYGWSTNKDERYFMVGAKCTNSACTGETYFNTIPNLLQEGDKVRFMMYVHNNGEDPNDGGTVGSPDAKNVKIGIDLNDMQDPRYNNMVRPNGFIYADNNQYKSSNGSIIKDSNGKTIRTASNDMQIMFETVNLELKPIEDSAIVLIPSLGDNQVNYIKNSKRITIPTETQSVTITATPHFEENKMWVSFDKYPGCFRYNSFIYFDVEVVKKPSNKCESLKGSHETTEKTRNELPLSHLTVEDVKFEQKSYNGPTGEWIKDENGNPMYLAYKWKSEDPNGKFYTFANSSNPRSNGATEVITLKADIFYAGKGPVSVELTALNHQLQEDRSNDFCSYGICTTQIQIPDICTKLEGSANLNEREINGKPLHTLKVETVDFLHKLNVTQGEIIGYENGDKNKPVYIGFKWISQDTEGRFYLLPTSSNPRSNNATTIVTTLNSTYYTGNGPIRVELTAINSRFEELTETPDYCNVGVCNSNIEIENPIEVCKEIEIKHNKRIIRGTISTFEAKATNTNNEPYSEKITYSVDEGYGEFFTGKPVGIENTDPIVTSGSTTRYVPPLPNHPITTQKVPQLVATINGILANANKEDNTIQTAYAPLTIGTLNGTSFELANTDTENNNLYTASQHSIFDGQLTVVDPPAFAVSGANSVTVDHGTKVYFVAYEKGEDVIHIQSGDAQNCARDFDIVCPECEEISLKHDKPNGIIEQQIVKIELNIISSAAIEEVKYSLTDENAGFFYKEDPTDLRARLEAGETFQTDPTGQGVKNLSMPSPNNTVYFFAMNAGTDVIEVEIIGPRIDDEDCIKTLSVGALPDPYTCGSLSINSTPSNPETSDTVTLTVSGTDTRSPAQALPDSTQISWATTAGGEFSTTTSTIADTVTFKNATQAGTLTATISNTDPLYATTCTDSVNITQPSRDVECVDLDIISPSRRWERNDLDDGDEHDFRIEVRTSPSGKENEFTYHWDVSPSRTGEWDDEITSSRSNTLEIIDADDINRVEVQAYDGSTPIPACRDTKSVYDDGDDDDDPEIEKSVFDLNASGWRNSIRIAGDNDTTGIQSQKYITYNVRFYPGDVETVEFTETSFENGMITAPLTDGYLKYSGMAIIVVPDYSNNDPYLIYKNGYLSPLQFDFKSVDGSNKRFSSYDNFNEDPDFFKEKYNCNETLSKICFEESYSRVASNFKNGETITLNNVDKLNNNDEIYIVYQLENNTIINEDECAKMFTFEGCGEEFENEIQYEAENDNNEWDGYDTAQVNVICPFVLTRESGDIFMHDEVESGMDVLYCGVQNTPLILRGKREKEQEAPNTGGTGTTEPTPTIITTPTHDVCKLSGYDNNNLPEEYQNAFKNFSSSVCEMESDVSNIWKEKFINEAIQESVEKLARGGIITRTDPLTSISDLLISPNSQSGVFIFDGDLTINGNTSYQIKGDRNVPAAQTYIIRGADLIIKSNIKYDDQGTSVLDPTKIPSAAFIVIDGNIIIDSSVTEIDGIIMAIDTDGIGDDGKFIASGMTYLNRLTIKGSIIGDIYDLFKNRKAPGDPYRDEGAITIRYDERLLLNTPPGLAQLVNIAQLRIAN